MGSSSASCAPYSNVAWNAKLPTPTRPNHWRNKSNARGQGTVPSNSLQSRPEDGFVSVLFCLPGQHPKMPSYAREIRRHSERVDPVNIIYMRRAVREQWLQCLRHCLPFPQCNVRTDNLPI